MAFRNPAFLLLFLPLLAAVARAYLSMAKRRDYAPKIRVPWQRLWRVGSGGFQVPPRFWHVLGYAVSCAFLIFALARPQTSYQKIKRNVEGIDIMLVLDLSASMRVEDFRDENRLEVSKPILRDFIVGRSSDKIGFVVFSGEPVTLVPPTLDYSLVLNALENASIGDLKDGTAIGDALSAAVARLKESAAKSKVIILVTDGDSNVGQIDPLTAGDLAKGFGIKVYSIAIGRDGRAALPFVHKDVFGRQVKTYQYFDSSINPELLKQISAMTDGRFYRVQDDAKVLKGVFEEIDKLERRKVETSEQVKYDERYEGLLKMALLAFLMTFFLQNTLLRVYP